jgi:hypothetical protein
MDINQLKIKLTKTVIFWFLVGLVLIIVGGIKPIVKNSSVPESERGNIFPNIMAIVIGFMVLGLTYSTN